MGPHDFTDKVQIIDIKNGDVIDGGSLQKKTKGANGAIFNGKPTICGGVYEDPSISKECFQYENNEWIEVTTLFRNR